MIRHIKVSPAIQRLFKEFQPHRNKLIRVVALGFVISAIQPISLKLSQKILDEFQKGNGLSDNFFKWVPIALIGIFLLSGLSKYFHDTTKRFVAESIIRHLRAALFQKYLGFSLGVLENKRTGEMLSSIQNDLAVIRDGIDTFFLIMKEPFTFIGLVGIAIYYDWQLALCTLFAAPLVALLFSRSGAAVKRYSSKNLSAFSDMMAVGQESIAGARVVKVFQLEDTLLQRFKNIQAVHFKTLWKAIRVEGLATPLIEFIGAILMAGVVVYGGYRISQGDLTSGKLVAFILALGLAQMPIKQLNNAYLKLKNAEAAAERVYSVLDQDTGLKKNIGTKRKHDLVSGIEFKNVGMSYGDRAALKNVSFNVKKGECIALVGKSGSGKTTLVNLLPRLYEITEGDVLFDGVRLSEIYLNDLRKMISFVTQETFLFNDTIFENIRYGNSLATNEQVEKAAAAAYCLDFIKLQPQGIHTRIGERGACLSGGERQRVAIARAILKNSPILVLDEATSNLDSQSEQIVQRALEKLIYGKTTFLVAHRLATVRKADKILVFEDGSIKESGTHSDLIGENGLYVSFLKHQTI